MTLGTTQQSAHRVFHRRGNVRSSASASATSAFATTLVMTMMIVLIHRLVVIHHFLDSRRRGHGCHFVATRFHHVHRVHVRSNPAGFLVRLLNDDNEDGFQRFLINQNAFPSIVKWNANRLHRSILCTGISIPRCDEHDVLPREEISLFNIRKTILRTYYSAKENVRWIIMLNSLYLFNIRIFFVLEIYSLYFRRKIIFFPRMLFLSFYSCNLTLNDT